MDAIQTQAIFSQNALFGSHSVKEGDLVFVRVLKALGGKNYLASFAGGRFSVRSEAPLFEGSVFRAKILLNQKNVLLVPQENSALQKTIGVQSGQMAGQEVAAFLQSLGLEADDVYRRILQFFLQNGHRLDAALMKKIRRVAKKFGGRENAAAEAALVLEEKGLDSDGRMLFEIMDFLEEKDFQKGNFESENFSKQDEENSKNATQNFNDLALEIAAELKNFFCGLEKNFLPLEIERDFEKKIFLAFFNQSKKNGFQKKSWVMAPFEFEINSAQTQSKNPISGRGVFKFFLDLEKNLCEKCGVNFDFCGKNLRFMIYFCDRKIQKIDFCAENFSEKNSDFFQKDLQSEFPKSQIRVLQKNEFSDFGTNDEPPSFAEGFA